MPADFWPALQLDRTADTPLTRQLAANLRVLVASGHLGAGERLPPTRELAAHLGVSRGTVTEAFETLCAEGYLEARVGAGTYVRLLPTLGPSNLQAARGQASARAQVLAHLPVQHSSGAGLLAHSRPDKRLFPWQTWARLEGGAFKAKSEKALGVSAAGLGTLREQVAHYLRQERGLRCTAEQIIVTTGTQQALGIAAHTLLDSGDTAGLEMPGYTNLQAALLAAGLNVRPLPVDRAGTEAGGLDTQAIWKQPTLRLVCTTPAHQFPTGAVLAPERRLELVRWAEARGGWIVEDDYDSEYRYTGPPLTPLAALSERVIHIGTFSATLFAGLRLGFLVAPKHLAPTFAAVKAALDRGSSLRDSATLAAFMACGDFARHLGRTRRAYAERHTLLLDIVTRLGGQPLGTGRGLHLAAHWPRERTLLRRAEALGLSLTPLSAFAWSASAIQEKEEGARVRATGQRGAENGLLLGFAAHTPAELQQAGERLAQGLR